jgi:hypothetical protein
MTGSGRVFSAASERSSSRWASLSDGLSGPQVMEALRLCQQGSQKRGQGKAGEMHLGAVVAGGDAPGLQPLANGGLIEGEGIVARRGQGEAPQHAGIRGHRSEIDAHQGEDGLQVGVDAQQLVR